MSKIYYTANVLFKTDEGSRNWCMGFSWAGGSLSPLRMNRAFRILFCPYNLQEASEWQADRIAHELALRFASARRGRIRNLMVAGKIPKGQCGMGEAGGRAALEID
jgi:hypothetical protein